MWKSLKLGAHGAGENETTLIATGATIEGNVHFSGTLELEGAVNGAIHGSQEGHSVVRILPGGHVHGDVHAPIVVVNGVVSGNVYSSEHVELAARAVIRGDVEYNLIEMTKGAQVEGRLHFRADDSVGRKDPVVPIETPNPGD